MHGRNADDAKGLSQSAAAQKLLGAIEVASGAFWTVQGDAEAWPNMTTPPVSAAQDPNLVSRASARFAAVEAHRQRNLDSIIQKALRIVDHTNTPDREADPDWLFRFVVEAQDVSDEQLRELWASLLAGEFRSPGRYPRRLFRVLKDLEPDDARTIAATASRVLHIEHRDGRHAKMLLTNVTEIWGKGRADEKRTSLLDVDIPEAQIWRELGLVFFDEYETGFWAEGGVSDMHLSTDAIRSIAAPAGQIVAAYLQPAFVEKNGPPVQNGRLMINFWVKWLMLNGWQLTDLGAKLVSLVNPPVDHEHFQGICHALVDRGSLQTESVASDNEQGKT